jgi:outer membrane protein OmpA-like peptidoglycan-associated protein
MQLKKLVVAFALVLLSATQALSVTPVPATTPPEGLEIERFKPTLDTRGVILTEGGQAEEAGEFDLGFYFVYSNRSLVTRSNNLYFKSLVNDRYAGELSFGMGITNWLGVGLAIPATFRQTGALLDLSTSHDYGLSSAALGDIRIVPKFTLLRENKYGISIALVVPVTVPSGDKRSFMGSGSLQGAPTLAISRHFFSDHLLVAANVGVWLRESVTYGNLDANHELLYRLGLSLRLVDQLSVMGEVSGTSKLTEVFTNDPEEVYLETLFGLRYRTPIDLWFTLGGAVGILDGWGTPKWRAFVGLMWAPRSHDRDSDSVEDKLDRCPDEKGPPENQGCPWPDVDKDGVPDNVDKCPNEAGPADNSGCPWPDTDGDGVTDNVDKCINEAGPADNSGCPWPDTDGDGVTDNVDKCINEAGPKENEGCPWPDADKDGVPDSVDKCPNEPGPKENNGCPWPDADKDGVLDNVDNCPTEPGPPENQGCPVQRKALVVIKAERIEILQKVHFQTGKSTIMPDSFVLLDQVAQVLASHENIKQVRVEGHTDALGPDELNLKLSQARADAVRDYLIKKGSIAPERVVAVGYGKAKPIATNATKKGREENRRVEFIIVEPAAGN